MFTPQRKAPFLTAVLFGLFAFMALAPAGRANSSYTYNLDCTTASLNSCSTATSYGTVTVQDYATNKVEVTVTLGSAYEFETNGPDPTLAFNIKNVVTVSNSSGILSTSTGNPTLNTSGTTLGANGFGVLSGAQTLTDPFTISTDPSLGSFTNGIECMSSSPGSCGGTLGDSVSFLVTAGTGTLTASDFVPNAKNFVFAANVGPSSGSSYIAAVPEPQWYGAILVAGLVALRITRNRSLKTNQV